MDATTLKRLLPILDRHQVETGRGLDIPAGRYLALASGEAATPEEAETLLASPLARELLGLAPAFAGQASAPAQEAPAPASRVLLFPRLLAAKGEGPGAESFERLLRFAPADPPWGTLEARPGFGGAMAWLLTLRLHPAAWPGGLVDGLRIVLTERGPGGAVWLSGVTDAAGEIRGVWAEELGPPRERWEALPDHAVDVRIR